MQYTKAMSTINDNSIFLGFIKTIQRFHNSYKVTTFSYKEEILNAEYYPIIRTFVQNHNSMKNKLCTIATILISLTASGQEQFTSVRDEFEANRTKMRSNHEKNVARMRSEHDAFVKRIRALWGEVHPAESTAKEWVEYSDDESQRSKVDFEKGNVTIEVIADPDEDAESINRKLEQAVEDLLASKGKTLDFPSEVMPRKEVTEEPVMDGQLDLSPYEDTGMTVPESIVSKKKKEIKSVDTAEGKKHIISIHMELVEDHIPKRAERFKEIIRKHSTRFDVKEPLIYAIMEQESAFNPMAKSHANAYGLMQLVPSSGGLDANRYVYNRNVEPTPEELFIPDFNIELGTGYLKKQMNVYFKGVIDPQCRILCAIAAYNTGQNNVYYTFTGKRKIDGAFKEINRYNYEQLYEHLKHNLPHYETRDYIEKVITKMQKYIR